MKEDGFEFEVVEQDGSPHHPFLPHPIPGDEKRFAVKPGDVVKLIFLYRDPVVRNGQTFSAEHMWVRVTQYGQGCLIGQFDDSPQFSAILKAENEVRFHPKHIVRFWNEDNAG